MIQLASATFLPACKQGPSPDLLILNGIVLTVDKNFTVCEALAVRGDRIIAVGSNDQISKLAGGRTNVIDAEGKTVIPGLIDAHLHPESASVSEIEDALPDIHSINELLEWVSSRTRMIDNGEWIVHPKLFFTRLIDMRPPTLAELDSVAPFHPVYLNGTYGGMINSMAMQVSGITEETNHAGILRDNITGQLTGFVRASAFNQLGLPPKKPFSEQVKVDAILEMFHRYHKYGITSICSGSGNIESFNRFRELSREGKLNIRVTQNITVSKKVLNSPNGIMGFHNDPNMVTGYGDNWVRIGALKVFLDGGILTGTAYLREPWGERAGEFFAINDEQYRGIINWSHEELLDLVKEANKLNWKFTAHCTGGGGVDILLDVYEQVNQMKSIENSRFSIIHGNFFSDQAIIRMAKLGIYADLQPAWFFKDADAMEYILGEKRIETFHPYRSLIDEGVMINGGSDHMVGWDADASVNPFNPFLGMWIMLSRTTERDNIILPSEAVTRQEALRIYTINNAYATFEESIKGSLEPGKLADIVILSGDLMRCPVDEIRNISSEMTILGGEIVYSSGTVSTVYPGNR